VREQQKHEMTPSALKIVSLGETTNMSGRKQNKNAVENNNIHEISGIISFEEINNYENNK
jgi:hypothetical protein